MITVIDYGMGNLRSVKNALDFLGIESEITADTEKIKNARSLILPGVGAFPDAAKMLGDSGIADIVREKCAGGTPLLGICLGMQLLACSSDEGGFTEGLGLIKGRCVKISAPGLKIPHMGWNNIETDLPECPLLKYTENGSWFYFVHSYRFELSDEKNTLAAHTVYCEKIPAVVTDGKNVFGAQFHPEKSEKNGLAMLRGFCEFCREQNRI